MKIKEKVLLFSQKYKCKNVGMYASSAAFFLFLSLVPIVVLLFSIVPYTPLTQDGVLEFLKEILPDSIDRFTVGVVAEVYGKQPALLSVSAVLTLWSAGKGMQAITAGLNEINGFTRRRSFVLVRIEACIYTVALLVMLIATVFVFVFGRVILNNILSRYIDADSLIHSLFNYRYLVECVLFSMLFTILYAWAPNRRTNPRKQIKGAAMASLLCTAFSWGFSIYLTYYNPFSMYGSLATVIILMIWIYTSMIFLMSGALLNVYEEPEPAEQPEEFLSVKRLRALKKNKSKEKG